MNRRGRNLERLWGINRAHRQPSPDAEANLGRDGVKGGLEGVARDDVTMPRAAPGSAWSGRRKCLLSALVAEEPTVGIKILVIYAHNPLLLGARTVWYPT